MGDASARRASCRGTRRRAAVRARRRCAACSLLQPLRQCGMRLADRPGDDVGARLERLRCSGSTAGCRAARGRARSRMVREALGLVAVVLLPLRQHGQRSSGHSACGISDSVNIRSSISSRRFAGRYAERVRQFVRSLRRPSRRARSSLRSGRACRSRRGSPRERCWSAAVGDRSLQRAPSALPGSAARFQHDVERQRSPAACRSVASSSTLKRAATSASNGNWCRRRVQKAWMVCTFRPPGVSIATANSRRASARIAGEGLQVERLDPLIESAHRRARSIPTAFRTRASPCWRRPPW